MFGLSDDAGREAHLLCQGWQDILQERLHQVGNLDILDFGEELGFPFRSLKLFADFLKNVLGFFFI